MIWTLVVLLLIILGCVLIHYGSGNNDNALGAGIMLVVVFSLIGVVLGVMIIGTQSTWELDYENKIYEKQVLEYRLEQVDDNITGNEMLYNDIVAFNNGLRETKRWANSPWTNWFFNTDVATIDYIEITQDLLIN